MLYMYFIYEMRKVQMWLTSSNPIGLQIRLRMLKTLVVTLVSVMISLEIVANLMVALSVVNGDKILVGWHQLVFLIVTPILLCCFLFFFTMNILNFRFFIQRKIRQAKLAGVKITARQKCVFIYIIFSLSLLTIAGLGLITGIFLLDKFKDD